MPDEISREAFAGISYGLYVVTSHADGECSGLIVNTVTQVASEPRRIAVSINKKNFTYELISKSGEFAVSVLDESTPRKFIGLFGFKSGRDVDKLSQVQHELDSSGCPLVTENALAVMKARVVSQVDAGTHTVFIADVAAAKVLREGKPLTYAYYRDMLKGKPGKYAPIYERPAEEQESKEGGAEMQKYVCDVCGYVYDPAQGDPDGGVEPGTPWDKLPDDWVCPVCGVGKDQFSPE